MRIELLENGVVVNTVLAADLAAAQAIFGPDCRLAAEQDAEPLETPDPRLWWMDTGPFRDRFDTYGYPGLKGLILGMARTNDACYAVMSDLVGRLYVDILGRRAELAAALAKVAEQVALAGKPEFTPAMQAAILETLPVEAERTVKGLA